MDGSVQALIDKLHAGDLRALARCISKVEDNSPDGEFILQNLHIPKSTPVIGITGPPGAGKSTMVNALINELLKDEKIKVGVLAVDPTSPFTKGSLLGDRLRMSSHFNDPRVYIRSLATRGALGGLSSRTYEIVDVMKAAGFDYLIIETVGVGQSEVEIAGLADVTLVIFVPESGDEIQAIKAGIIEIADIFVVNKADRAGADKMIQTLQLMVHERPDTKNDIPVIKTVASEEKGVEDLFSAIKQQLSTTHPHSSELMYRRALHLAGAYLLKKYDQKALRSALDQASKSPEFNIHRFLAGFLDQNPTAPK